MKKSFSIVLLSFMAIGAAFAQPHYYQVDKPISVAAGYSNIHMNVDTFHAFYLEMTYYMNPSMGWEFSSRVEYGKDYLSIEPIGLIAVPTWIYTSSHGMGRKYNMIGAFLSITSAKLPIAVDEGGLLEVTPYWSFLKLTRFYDDGFRLNGDLGLQIKLFPLALFNYSNTLCLSGFAQWNWGYSRNHNRYGRYNIKYNRSDSFGYAIGLSLGYYF